jgi:hypothetical protein
MPTFLSLVCFDYRHCSLLFVINITSSSYHGNTNISITPATPHYQLEPRDNNTIFIAIDAA